MRRNGRTPISRRAWALTALFVLVACDAPKPTLTPQPAEPTSDPTPSITADATPVPTAAPRSPGAMERINDGMRTGAIDVATGYLYRLYAQWGDPRLPAEYRGARENDHVLASTVEELYQTLPPDQQATLLPVVVRPTHEASYWATMPEGATATGSNVQPVSLLARDPRCNEDGWARTDLPQLPVTIWARCAIGASGDYQLVMAGDADIVALSMTALWGPMTRDMGRPIPDAFRAPLGLLEVDEAGDGRLDIYLVNGPNQAYDRDLTIRLSAPAMAVSTAEERGSASSGYIVIDVLQNRKPHELESTLAHEFFHVLQFAHEQDGTITCPYPSVTSSCAQPDRVFHWFVEASASWAEHRFVPHGRSISAYPRWEEFRGVDHSLALTDTSNEYASYVWPLFMQQESPRGERAIADAWRAIAGKSGWLAVQQALDSVLPFEDKFRDFAVRAWNEKLEPGDPINPRFNDPALDRDFPTTRPEDGEVHLRYKEELNLELDVPDRQRIEIPELWAAYYKVNLLAGAHQLTMNFAGLTPNNQLDVDALVYIRNVGWERRELDPITTEICLDRPQDAIENLILVLSNHSQTPNEHIKGDWTATAETAGCVTATDSLVYTSVREQGGQGAAFYQSTTETLTVRLSLKSSSSGFGLEDDASTFHATLDTNGYINGLVGANCDTIIEAHGGTAGPIPPEGGINAGIFQDELPTPSGQSGTATGPPRTVNIMSISVSVPIEVNSSMSSCAGTDTQRTTMFLTTPTCDGTEILGAAGPGIVFDFHCGASTPGWRWSLVGKVRFNL